VNETRRVVDSTATTTTTAVADLAPRCAATVHRSPGDLPRRRVAGFLQKKGSACARGRLASERAADQIFLRPRRAGRRRRTRRRRRRRRAVTSLHSATVYTAGTDPATNFVRLPNLALTPRHPAFIHIPPPPPTCTSRHATQRNATLRYAATSRSSSSSSGHSKSSYFKSVIFDLLFL
jgi:hypothetical protein